MPGVAYAIRSKKGRIVLDEAAFTDEFEEIKKAALALLIWAGSFSIISTHNGDDSPFCLFLKSIRDGKEKKWSVHRTTFNDAVEQGLYKRICLKNEKKWSAKGEKEFVKDIRDIYKMDIDLKLKL